MTYALIDNATITGVQRITGEVKTRSMDSVDTDLVALENIIQAILFYDELIAIDDYIPEHKDQRHQSFPFIRFIEPEPLNLNQIEQKAASIAGSLKPEIRGGEFANEDFKKFFDLLKTHIVCTWDMTSSVYYLTLKALAAPYSEDFNKYGNIAAGIFAELQDARNEGEYPKAKIELVDSFGKSINKGYTLPGKMGGETGGPTGALSAFASSLIWLANRSIYYSLSANYLKADTFLYPIRQAYQQHYIAQTCHYGHNYAKHLVDNFSTALSKDLINIHSAGLATATAIDLPVFSAWIAKETGDPRTIIQAAQQIRNESPIKEARDQLREVKRLFDDSDLAVTNKAVNKILEDLKKNSVHIQAQFGLKTKQGIPITRLVHVYNTIAAVKGLPTLPDYDFKVTLPAFLSNLKKPSGLNSLYRNITHDLSTVWALGEARDILGSKVTKDEEGGAYSPKCEDPKYRHVRSHWKSPM